MVETCCCCWRKKEKLHSAVRLSKRSRSLEKVNLGKYTSLSLEDKYLPAEADVTDQSVTAHDNFNMGNSLSPESLESQRDNPLKKTDSSVSLKSSSSVKSSSSRRSKVTFTEHNPEVHMIPPKSPPKPKRTRNAKPPTPSEDDIDLLILDDEGESAFQFDQCNKAELTSIEDLSGSGFKNKSSKKSKKDKATEDYKVTESVKCLSPFYISLNVLQDIS